MCKEYLSLQLKDEITLFRQKLDNLLMDPESTSEEILTLSQKLDILILKYYALYEKQRKN